jgi:membrane-bound serine protease (ClpP class)
MGRAHRTCHIFLSFAALFALAAPLSAQPEREAAQKQYQHAVVIPMEGPITPMLERFLFRRLDAAQSEGADLVIVEIDSPGGLLEESFNIAERLRAIDWATTVAYVPDQALSGAAIAALGCNEIVMHPHARLGDAGPIFLAEDALFRHAPEKLVSDLAVRMRRLAESTGRPPALAEAMVDRNCEVFEATNQQTDEKRFLSEADLAHLDDENWEKGKLVFESRKDHFLEVEGERAVELRLAEATVTGIDDLKQRYQWTGELRRLEHTWVDTLVFVLNQTWVTVLLLIVGMVCLYIEFSAPGTGIGGTIAGLCFVLFFWSRVLGGTSGWLEVILFLSGVVLVIVEVFVMPGFGFSGVTGALLIVASLIMASQRFVIPETEADLSQLTQSLAILVGSGIAFLFATFVLHRYFHLVPALSGIVLAPPESADMPTASSAAAPTASIVVKVGQEGTAITPLRPAGRVRFEDQSIDVFAEGSYIAAGKVVRVVEVQGRRILVVELSEAASPPA